MLTPAGPPAGPIRQLTDREEQVVEGVRRGRSYAEIGRELGIATVTVKQGVERVAGQLIYDADLGPRDAVFLWANWRHWQRQRAS